MVKTVHGTITLPFAAFVDTDDAADFTPEQLADYFGVTERRFYNYSLLDDTVDVVVWDTNASISITKVEDGDSVDLGSTSVMVGSSDFFARD